MIVRLTRAAVKDRVKMFRERAYPTLTYLDLNSLPGVPKLFER
jgi:hypothetical protein